MEQDSSKQNFWDNRYAAEKVPWDYLTPQEVKSIGMDVLRHHAAITYEAEAEETTSETVIQKTFNELPVPKFDEVKL